jgi:hypothetical protein
VHCNHRQSGSAVGKRIAALQFAHAPGTCVTSSVPAASERE